MHNKLLKILLICGMVFGTGVLNYTKKCFRTIQKQRELILRKEKNLKTYEKWINKIYDKKSISNYLKENGCSKIAIYGMGHIGRNIYRELKDSGLEVVYGIDCAVSSCGTLKCYHLDEKLPETDMIIVTVSTEIDIIIEKLKEKVQCQICSLNDILFML